MNTKARNVKKEKNIQDKKLIISELRYRRLFETAQDGILLIDFETGMILDVNPFLITLLGYSKTDFLEKHLWEVGVFKDVAASKDNFLTLQKKKYVRFEDLPLETKTGKKIDVEFVANAYKVDKTTIIQCNIRDITERVIAENALNVLSLRQTTILQAIPDIIMEVDINKIYTWANQPGLDFFGDEVIGKTADFYFQGEQTVYRVIQPLFKGSENTIYLESWQKRKDGQKRLLAWWCRALKDKKGNITGALSSARDITDHKRMENQVIEDKLRDEAILSSIGDAVFATDKNGKILLFNRMAEELIGVPSKEAIGSYYKEIATFVKESDGKPSDDFIVEAITKNKKTKMANHTLLIRKDGYKIPVADSAAPIKNNDGETIGCVVVFRDATKEREIDRAKTEFVSLASHQLRTPTTSINWYSEMLLEGEVGALNEKQKEYLKEIHHGNQRMIELVNALLSVSRIELGTFAIQLGSADITTIADDVLEELQTQIDEKKLKIEKKYKKGVPIIKSDRKLIRIVFQNLLSNAVAYTTSKGKISIEIKKTDMGVHIEIEDDGCGIPYNAQPTIYTKFFRADNARAIKSDGTGLGLYITKSIIKTLGGTISFKSKEGDGTTFSVDIFGRGMTKKVKKQNKTTIF